MGRQEAALRHHDLMRDRGLQELHEGAWCRIRRIGDRQQGAAAQNRVAEVLTFEGGK
jgi:hypothetical protein